MAITLTLTKKRVRTNLPGASPTKDWDDADITNSENRIGERKRLHFEFTSDTSLANTNIYISPALFIANGYVLNVLGPPAVCWSCNIPNTSAATYTCSYNGGGNIFPDRAINYEVSVEVIDGTHFKVYVDFFQTYDTGSYLTPVNDDNHARLLKDRPANTSELVVSGSSVYNDTNVDGRCLIYVEDAVTDSNYGYSEVTLGGYKAGFFSYNNHNAAPYFSVPAWTVKYAGNAVTNIKSIGDNDVEFTISSPAAPTAMYMWIIRTDTNNMLTDFITNYEHDLQDITSSNTGGTKIKGPYVDLALVSGTTYKATFKIDGTLLTVGGTYRMIAVVYNTSGVYKVNSFISDEYSVSADNEYTGEGIEFKGRLCDVQREFTGDNLECVIEERMKSKIRLNFFNDKFKDDVFNRLGLVITNDIRRYLTSIEFTIYEEYTNYLGDVKNIFDYRVLNKISMASYLGGDIDSDFQTDYAEFAAEWRNRYETATSCIQTLVNDVNFLPLQADQYWGGKTLKIDWKFTFYYDDYVSPFTDEMVYTQQIRVKDYEPALIEISSDSDIIPWCNNVNICMAATVDPTQITSEYNLINNIEVYPGNSSAIEEREEWVPDELAQETTDKISDQEIAFDETEAGKAKWCIDTSKLSLNSQYKISAIAKKYYARYRFITEDSLSLIKTETMEQLVNELN